MAFGAGWNLASLTTTPPSPFLLNAGLKIELAEVAMRPTLENALSGDDGIKMQKILDALDDLDDVQEVYTTAVIED